jgi:uncharacterized protein YxjI
MERTRQDPRVKGFALAPFPRLKISQRAEPAEWFGIETRNSYDVTDEHGHEVAFAAEQGEGVSSFFARQWLGHWRSFEIVVYTAEHDEALVLRHPFRPFLKRLEVLDDGGELLGTVQQRFSLLSKRFDVLNAKGQVIMEVASPIWKRWTFPFTSDGREVARVKKKWSGFFSEAFTDRDDFAVEYGSDLSEVERRLVLAAALFVDLAYFERKASD